MTTEEMLAAYPVDRVRTTKERLARFWQGGDLGRPPVVVNRAAPKYNQQYDLETMMQNALQCLLPEAFLPGDNVPGFWSDLGPLALASAFGGRVRNEETPPWIDPVFYEAEQVDALPEPVLEQGLAGECIRRARVFLERCEGKVDVRPLDMQGPLNTAGLVWEQQRFLMAMHTDPDAVHRLLDRVTRHTIAVFRAFQREFGPRLIQPFYPEIWMPSEYGVGITEDLMPLISARSYREFGLPYTTRIAEAFGGVFIHCCGAFERHLPALADIPNLRGIEFHYPYTRPEAVHEVLGDGRRVFIIRRGPHAEAQFPDPVDFTRFVKGFWERGMRLMIVLDDAPDNPELLKRHLDALGLTDAWGEAPDTIYTRRAVRDMA